MASDASKKSVKPHSRTAESLGWLSESTVQPKKHRYIEGISASSRLNLEAQVYKSKEEALLKREGKFEAPVNRRTAGIDVSQIRNAGVEERNKRDVEQLEVLPQNMTEEQRQAKLEWKQQQYEAMAAGRLDDEDDKYNVDFVRKGYLEEAKPGRSLPPSEPVDSTGMALGGLGGMMSADMRMELERREWEQAGDEEDREHQQRQERVKAVREEEERAKVGRERAAREKKQREDKNAAQRNKLMKQTLDKLMQGKKAAAKPA